MSKTSLLRILALVTAVLFLLVACRQPEEPTPEAESAEQSAEIAEDMTAASEPAAEDDRSIPCVQIGDRNYRT